MGKVAGVLDEFIQPFKTGPLVDQNGTYTRNAIMVNQPMFNDIVNNALYSKEGQQSFFTKAAATTTRRTSTPSTPWSTPPATPTRTRAR